MPEYVRRMQAYLCDTVVKKNLQMQLVNSVDASQVLKKRKKLNDSIAGIGPTGVPGIKLWSLALPGHPSSPAKNILALQVTVSSTLKWFAEVC